MISQIKKRDGSIVDFDVDRIALAIEKTMLAVSIDDDDIPKSVSVRVAEEINKLHPEDYVPTVEEIQDVVEKVLISEGHASMAKAYILFRQKRSELRKLKENILGRLDDSKLSVNGLLIAKSRYLLINQDGRTIETPKEMFKRVAKSVAGVEKKYKKEDEETKKLQEEFFEILNSLEFVPSGRILANAGKREPMLYSSFVLPLENSMKGIFRGLYHKAMIQKLGGGTGFSFSKLSQKGKKLETSSGYSSGPIAFIKLFDHASELTTHSGNRKPANMGSLSVEHPDIVEFITMKERKEIQNFNISVELTDNFMEAVKTNGKYDIKDPATGEVIEAADANNIFHLIVTMAWKTGDPGVLFIDRINASNPLPKIARIETTDPCGDQLLLPYEGGNLGAINLAQFTRNHKIKWKHIEHVTRLAVRFLDNVVDLAKFPIKKTEDIVKGTRRIGLGVMGFADMLYRLRIPYNSDKALETAEKIMKFIASVVTDESQELAKEKGVFPLWESSIYKGKMKLRNASLLAIAPTGSRSILVDSSAGIEPNFGLGYMRKVLGTTEILQLNKVLEEELKEKDLYSDEIIRKIIRSGSLADVDVPQEMKDIFITAYDINPEWHIKIQAVFQKSIDNAISKTINFPKSATINEIKETFMMAYDLGCKGLTVYREGSLPTEVITIGR
ncbi:MAG: adenosylcobalamin-dependent ribonucleoside-diphosphate reductase [archaeon]